MKIRQTILAGALLFSFTIYPLLVCEAFAQGDDTGKAALATQYEKIQNNLEQTLQELSKVQEQIAAEKLPISKELSRREEELSKARATYEDLSSRLDTRNMDLNNLRAQIDSLSQQKTYISSLLGEYVRNLETQLHIAEVQTYEDRIKEAKLALTNDTLEISDVFEIQIAAVETSVERLERLNGGLTFQGQAVGEGGIVMEGEFALIGPAAYFTAKNGTTTGHVVELLGSSKPSVISFEGDSNSSETSDRMLMTQSAVQSGKGRFPIDPTLGDAHKIAQTKDTLWEHIRKGGIVMIPILALALLALVIAIGKWIQLARVKMPSAQNLTSLLSDIRDRAVTPAKRKARLITGPAGEMLQTAVDHLRQPKELVEEVMYERILETRTRLNKALPFIAVCASSAPLLGLLGTVTGIINTFKLISAFGSGDAKTLSGGISEALVTTEFGLIVAIPSLLLHAFLNRRAKSLVDRMERIAVGVMNQITQAHFEELEESEEIDTSIQHLEKEIAHG